MPNGIKVGLSPKTRGVEADQCWNNAVLCADTAGIAGADHLSVLRRLIAAGKPANMCEPSGELTEKERIPICSNKGFIFPPLAAFSSLTFLFSDSHSVQSCSLTFWGFDVNRLRNKFCYIIVHAWFCVAL